MEGKNKMLEFEEVNGTAFGSALFGIAETIDYHFKKLENSLRAEC